MRRALLLSFGLALSALVTGAGAATFEPVWNEGFPSAAQPNLPGTVAFPILLSAAPEQPQRRSYSELLRLWRRAGAAYGVPWQVLAAINVIESDLGRNMGPSSGGALGWMQFIPDSWHRWGMDASGDGIADPWNPEDAVFAAARYLAAAGAARDLSRAILAYNHAGWYVRDVRALAARFAAGAEDEPDPAADRVVFFTRGGQEAQEARYVFPVAGGPELVSVGHDHHDYPAADIAAPAGSPVLALADAVVLEAHSQRLSRCGVGLTLQIASGASYTYCHLSRLEPGIVVGATLVAGAPVGRVGSSGHASGPHLHLQLAPAVAFPQEQPWFSDFAGRAFSWQDGGGERRTLAAAGERLFSVERDGEESVVFFTR